MNCPACNASVDDSAKTCAACGWKKSGSSIWIWILAIVGVLGLACAGFLTWGYFKVRGVMADATPMMLHTYRYQVVVHAKANRGILPKVLAEAVTPGQGAPGTPTVTAKGNSGSNLDGWMNPVRYTPNEDGTFEIRSAGADATMDTADDIAVTGSVKDSLKVLELETRLEALRMGRSALAKFTSADNPELAKADKQIEDLVKEIEEARKAGDDDGGADEGDGEGSGDGTEDGGGAGPDDGGAGDPKDEVPDGEQGGDDEEK
jgi:hypothetical protein